jgi:membrane protease YdiL (CAAX protease family)
MSILDHLLALIILVIHPVVGYLSFRRIQRRAAAGETIRASALYVRTIRGHWILFGVALVAWLGSGRSLEMLGFGLQTDSWFLLAVLLTGIAIAVMAVQLNQLARAPADKLQTIRDGLGSLEFILPKTPRDLRLFYGVSVTAGIVEETLWRGFLIWYLGHFMPLWAAAAISVVGFGLAHAYQGIANIAKTALVGAAFAALFVLSGSLWLPMLLHALVDILQGRAAYDVVQRTS